jgi:serine/threonine protein kinase/tetratricopeptide (TPR) repeat protein
MAVTSGIEARTGTEALAHLDDVLSAFKSAWQSGATPRSEDWLGRLDAGRPAEASELIYLEFCLAEADGLDPIPGDYIARFPEHGVALSRLFELHALTSSADWTAIEPPSDLPEEGDEIGPYRLVRELGRGSFARVFLAEQSDLDRRHVVVKVSTRPSPEPRLLARASHAHIVEVLKHTTANDDALQIVCMPFLGGETLAAVNREKGRRLRSGRDLLATLDRVSASEYPRADVPRPAREILGRLSYPKAIAWIFARLAEALDHACRKGVVHGDIKPSNILLTADGMPMLFDFNLAVDWHDDDTPLDGGTLAYMAPERLRPLAAARSDELPPVDSADRHRADVYALGLVLVETLTGVAPSAPTPRDGSKDPRAVARAIAESRAGGTTAFTDWESLKIPAGLRPILAHCLAADPGRRYIDGQSLSKDLDRWRCDLSPLAAPDARWPVPLIRQIRRHRLTVAAGVLTLVGAAGAGVFTSIEFESTVRGKSDEKYSRFLDKDDVGLFGYHQFGAGALDTNGDPADNAMRKLRQYGVYDDASWRTRDDVRGLNRRDRDDLELLMLEQVYRLARAWADRPDSLPDWKRALALVDRECETCPCSALVTLRSLLRDKIGVASPVATPGQATPAVWVEEYMLGVVDLELHAHDAFQHFGSVAALRPDLLWPRYRAGAAAIRLGKYSDANTHLRAAVNLRPNNPALHTSLAAALIGLSRSSEAMEECDLALEIDPEFIEALRSLAIAEKILAPSSSSPAAAGRFAIRTRLRGRAEPEQLRLQSFFHLRRTRRWDEDQASLDRDLRKFLTVDPANPTARIIEAERLRRSGHAEQAVALLDMVLDDHPSHLGARYDRAVYLRELGDPKAGEELEALINDPRFEELYREHPDAIRTFHLVTYDRVAKGHLDDALLSAEMGLRHSLRNNHLFEGYSYYSLARVHASMAQTDSKWFDSARQYLGRAVDLSPGLADMKAADPVFSDPRFRTPTRSETASDSSVVHSIAP